MNPSYLEKKPKINWKKFWEWLKKLEMSCSINSFTV